MFSADEGKRGKLFGVCEWKLLILRNGILPSKVSLEGSEGNDALKTF